MNQDSYFPSYSFRYLDVFMFLNGYRMSLKEEIDEKYPYLDDDLYTSNMSKELLAKYLDSYLHFLSLLPGIQEHVHKLRKISSDVFQLLVKLRRPTDPLGKHIDEHVETICANNKKSSSFFRNSVQHGVPWGPLDGKSHVQRFKT